MAETALPLAQLLPHVDALAQDALALWDLPQGAEGAQGAQAVRINVSENVTYRVEAGGAPIAVLRVHRAGYHSRAAIESELAWMAALEANAVVKAPVALPGRDGALVQKAASAQVGARHLVLFEHLPGAELAPSVGLLKPFEGLGAMAARMHLPVQGWARPKGFERLTWDADAVFGPGATWGDWRAAPFVDPVRAVLEAAEAEIRARLAAYGKGPDRYGLIHADMRLANLLVTEAETRLIDFDDCGFGWYLYDFAAAISFIETDPLVPDLKAAWLKGYLAERALTAEDAAMLDTMILLRRMALLAWIGSHIEAPEPQALAPDFAAGTARLAQAYLAGQAVGG